ncbi:MAG: Membrane protein DedA, SNARE-associated domain [Hydrocarboniphaga sp.]|uniref:DedA family protein/thiosulfate sulfurtransferase GlpE n=1 Tax=Hydrocarboniphaga sp. TaxID=2033016 RepID=UPI0026360889|nr:DedA family protein/thiosulfate sulfurtransferase GlpE [Hydrocarboniphaga sp.]MDB5971309.1 Membrane protein DedA, SNARE-associated domain [Hydrocarboniphaga sp.]
MLTTLDPQLLGPLLATLCVFAASLGLPVPTMPALIFAGSVIAGSGDPVAVAGLSFGGAWVGAVAGDTLWYAAGRRYGFAVLRLLCQMSLSRDTCVRRTESFFERRGVRILLVARFVPGLSVVSVPMSGTARVPFARFAIHDATGAALWIVFGLLLGYLFAGQIDFLMQILHDFGLGIGAAVVITLASFIGFRWLRRRRLLQQLQMSRISVQELYGLMSAGPVPVIIDVRTPESRRHDPFLIPGARTLDILQLEAELVDLTRKQQVILYCSCPNEISAAIVAQRLRKLGFDDVRPLLGGLEAWRSEGWQLQPIVAMVAGDTSRDPSVIGVAVREVS